MTPPLWQNTSEQALPHSSLSSALSHLGPTNQQLAAFTQDRAWQPTKLGANQAYQIAHTVS